MGDEPNIFERPYRPLKSLSRPELEQEVERWRNLWTWNEELLQYWLTKVRSPIKVKMRNFASVDGLLGQPRFELKSIDIDTIERIYNYARGEATYETKTVTIPINQLIDIAFIHAKDVVREPYGGETDEPEKLKPELELS